MPRVGDDGARGTGGGKVDGYFRLAAGDGDRAGACRLCIFMYIYIYVCIQPYVYIYIYISVSSRR